MKKLITICLLMATIFSVNAQDGKPTKEQTLTYLSKTFALSEGESFDGQTFDVYNFSNNKIIENYNTKNNGSYVKCNDEYKDFKWETFELVTSPRNSLSELDNLCKIVIRFGSNFKAVLGCDDASDVIEMNDKYLYLYILKTKAESFKKAIERLVEIAKEENKNPFEK